MTWPAKVSRFSKANAFWFMALATVFFFSIFYFWHYINDDAYITLRYSRNLASGLGPYFNSGEHVEGYTNFLLMALMSIVIRLLGPDFAPVAAKLLGSLCGIATVWLTFLLFRHLFRSIFKDFTPFFTNAGGFIAGLTVAGNPSYALNCTSGLETSMFSFWLVLAVLIDVQNRGKDRWLGHTAAFCMAILTRPEGVMLFVVYWASKVLVAALVFPWHDVKSLFPHRIGTLLTSKYIRSQIASATMVAFIFLCHLTVRLIFYDREWLPNTYYAKQGGFWGYKPWTYTWNGLLLPIFGWMGILGAMVGFVLLPMRRELAKHSPIFALAAAAIAMPFLTGTDWMLGYRFVIPYLPIIAVIIASGWMSVLAKAPKYRSALALAAILLLLPSLWFWHAHDRVKLHAETTLRAHGYQTGHIALADWIKARSMPGDSIALMDIGIIGYRCFDLNILDITGLTDRFIAKSPGGFLTKTYDPSYVLGRHPTFIVLTLAAPGTSYQPPAPGTSFTCGTSMERKIVESPEFRRNYMKTSSTFSESNNWLDMLAHNIGAVKVFEHGYPGCYYLLAVFSRNSD